MWIDFIWAICFVWSDLDSYIDVAICTLFLKRNAYRKHFLQCVVAPGIFNAATNWYTDGVMVSNISHSGVMTQIRRDALRREVARIDGRGNVSRIEYDRHGRVAALERRMEK